MKESLAQLLVDRKIFSRETELTINYMVLTIGYTQKVPAVGSFVLRGFGKDKDGLLVFSGVNTVDGAPQKFKSDSIIFIDGMEPERYAYLFGIVLEGEIKTSKKRGRKPKGWVSDE